MVTEPPTDAEEALEWLRRAVDRPHTSMWLQRGVLEKVATLRAALAAKDAEIERWRREADRWLHTASLMSSQDAENRGFREAAEWADAESKNRRDRLRSGSPDGRFDAPTDRNLVAWLRAEADRREGK